MTSPPSSRRVTDEVLLEMLFRTDRFLNTKDRSHLHLGEVEINNNSCHSLDVFVDGKHAFTYWKPEDEHFRVSLRTIKGRCDWSPSNFWAALKVLRELQVLDDLADISVPD